MTTDPLLLTIAAACAAFTLGFLYWLSRSKFLGRIVDASIITLDDGRQVFNGGFDRRGKYLVPDEQTRTAIKARVRNLYLWTFGCVLLGLQALELFARGNQPLLTLGLVAAIGVAARAYLWPLTQQLPRFDGALTWSDRKAHTSRYFARFSTTALVLLLAVYLTFALGSVWLLWHNMIPRSMTVSDAVEYGFVAFGVLLFGASAVLCAAELLRRLFGRSARIAP